MTCYYTELLQGGKAILRRLKMSGARMERRASPDEERRPEVDEEEDGLAADGSPESIDELFLGGRAADDDKDGQGDASQPFHRWRVDHGPGDFKYSCEHDELERRRRWVR